MKTIFRLQLLSEAVIKFTPLPQERGQTIVFQTGRVRFAFEVPLYGNTEFQFRTADFNFKNTSYDWLVVAQFKGSGTINGSGNYGFMLTAIDGQINGGGGVDKFRIKIWDKATGNIIYDNQLGSSDNDSPITAIGGGSIIIHKQ